MTHYRPQPRKKKRAPRPGQLERAAQFDDYSLTDLKERRERLRGAITSLTSELAAVKLAVQLREEKE